MKLYKFKDFTEENNHPHFLQIVLERKIWCACPNSLYNKDENEFNFEIDYTPTIHTEYLLTQFLVQSRSPDSRYSYTPPYVASQTLINDTLEELAKPIINNIIQMSRSGFGITSFAYAPNAALWKEHAGNGNGACIEIDIPDSLVGQSYHHVSYVKKKVFHVDTLLEATLSSGNDKAQEVYENNLLTKTNNFCYENEVRFVSNQQNVNFIFDGHISKVIFGAEIPHKVYEKLLCQINNHCKSNNITITTNEI